MPELPEVETTARGMSPHLVGQRIESFDSGAACAGPWTVNWSISGGRDRNL